MPIQMECKICGSKKVYCKKRELCSACYGRERTRNNFKPDRKSFTTINTHENIGEVTFVKNYFKGNLNWQHISITFSLSDGTRYTPDFYDEERNVLIEVSATRQAYHKNKHKYDLFRKQFPKFKLEIRDPNGQDIENAGYGSKWEFQLKAI